MNTIAQFPHCDALVLHAPGECKYCDMHPDWQQLREMWRVSFTGHNEPNKIICPSEAKRSIDTINKWGGNVPVPEGYTTIMYSPELVTEDEERKYWEQLEEEFAPKARTKPEPKPQTPNVSKDGLFKRMIKAIGR